MAAVRHCGTAKAAIHLAGGNGYAVQRAHRVDALTLEGEVVPVRDAVVSAARGYQLEDVEPDLVAYCLVQRSLANGRQVGPSTTLDTPQRGDQACRKHAGPKPPPCPRCIGGVHAQEGRGRSFGPNPSLQMTSGSMAGA